jgi:hypothetical protein
MMEKALLRLGAPENYQRLFLDQAIAVGMRLRRNAT